MELERLKDFDALTFDCYGTLIDWESGICAAVAPWLEARGVEAGREPSARPDSSAMGVAAM